MQNDKKSSLEERAVFIGCACFAVCLLPVAVWPSSSMSRVTSGLLDLFGLLAVAYGLERTRTQFGERPVGKLMRNKLHRAWVWLCRVFGRGPKPAVGWGRVSMPLPTAKAYGTNRRWIPDDPDGSVEQRLLVVINNQGVLREDNGLLRRRLDEHSQALKRSLEATDVLKSDIARTTEKLKGFATGGLRIEAVGLSFLVAALPFGLAPEWMADIFREFWALLHTLVAASTA